MSEIKQEQLDKVSGGKCKEEQDGIFVLGQQISKDRAEDYLGREVAILDKDHPYVCFVYGTLKRSYVSTRGCGSTRVAEIKIHPGCNCDHTKNSDGYVTYQIEKDPMYLITQYLK